MIYGHTAYGWGAGYPVAGNPQLGLVMEPGRLNPLLLPANEKFKKELMLKLSYRIDNCNQPH